LAAFPVTSF